MQLKEYLQELYEYNYWANRRILNASVGLSEEQLRADTGLESIYAALLHIMVGERGWRLGFQTYFVKAGEPVQNTPEWDFPELAAADYPTLDALRAAWTDEERIAGVSSFGFGGTNVCLAVRRST